MSREKWQHDQDADEQSAQSQKGEPQRDDRFPSFGDYSGSMVGGFASLVMIVFVLYPAMLGLLDWAKPMLMDWGLEDFAKRLKNRFRQRGNPLGLEYALNVTAALIVAYPFLRAINFGWRKFSGVLRRDRSQSRKTRIT